MLAIKNNEIQAVPLLIEMGENPEFISNDNKTALSIACFLGYKNIVKYLRRKNCLLNTEIYFIFGEKLLKCLILDVIIYHEM